MNRRPSESLTLQKADLVGSPSCQAQVGVDRLIALAFERHPSFVQVDRFVAQFDHRIHIVGNNNATGPVVQQGKQPPPSLGLEIFIPYHKGFVDEENVCPPSSGRSE